MAPIIADDLIQQVRDQIDEQNTTTISDAYILQCLNRGQDYVSNILARKYPEPLLAEPTSVTTTTADSYDMPEDIFEDRLLKVELEESGRHFELTRIEYRDRSPYTIEGGSQRPQYWFVRGKTYNIVPAPTAGLTLKLWYLKALDPLVKQQGRITAVDTGTGIITVDELGEDLTTSSEDLYNYINIVDGQTGEIKSSHQIQSLNTSTEQITIKSSNLTRSTVYNRTISTTISSEAAADDYVCVSRGNCVMYLKQPLTNHVIQYAVVEAKRRLGEPTEADERALAEFERQTEKTWVGRESSMRVKKRSAIWNTYYGRNRLRF